MADYPIISPGLDPTALGHDMTNAEALVLVNEAQFADTIGGDVLAEVAPDVVLYPILKRFVWVEIDGTGTKTGNKYYWNGTSWTLERPSAGVIDGDSFADGSIPVTKLSGAGASALYIIQRNAANTGWQIVSVASAIQDNSITPQKNVNAAGAGYILYSGIGGVFGLELFETVFDNLINFLNLPYIQVVDTGSLALPGQVLYFAATGGVGNVGYIENLLRANQTELSKLKFPVGSAGKTLIVNATETNIDFSASAGSGATLKDVQPSGTIGQAIAATTPTKLRLNTCIDPKSMITFSDADDTFALQAGTYQLEAFVPFHESVAGPSGLVYLYNETAGAIVATASGTTGGDQDTTTVHLLHTFTISTATTYSLRVRTANNTSIGIAQSVGGYDETYTQINIRKLF